MSASRPIVLRKSEWEKIKSHVNARDMEKREIERQEAYIKHLNDMSEKIKQQWEKAKEEEELKKTKLREAAELEEFKKHMKFYRELMEKQKLRKEQISAERRDTFFKQKDEPRALESALLCSEMLKEQQKQREFNMELKKREKQLDLEYAIQSKKDYERWLRETDEKRLKKSMKYQNEFLLLKAQAEENIKLKQKLKEDQLKSEIQDIEKALKENKEEEKRIIEKKNKIKSFVKTQREEDLQKTKSFADEKEKIDKIEDKIINIYNETKEKLQRDCEIKQKQIYKEREEIRSVVIKAFEDNTDAIKLKEEEKLRKAQEESRKKEIDRLKKEKLRREMLKQQKIEAYKEYLEEKEKQAAYEQELKKYEYENRLEHEKNTKAFNELMLQREFEKRQKNRNSIIQQLEDKEKFKEQQQADRIKFFHTDKLKAMEAADKKFIQYAEELLNECEKTGKPTLPLLKVINNYKSRYLPPEKFTPNHLKTHAPPAIKK